MNKLLVILTIAISILIAKPGHKGGKPLNKGSVNSTLKGANSVVKPNKYKKYNKGSKDYYKKGDKLERDVTKAVLKSII